MLSVLRITLLFSLAMGLPLARAAAFDVALVTAVDGAVSRQGAAGRVESFVKLKEGDRPILDKAGRLQIVYFDNGRQETWTGSGNLEIGIGETKSRDAAPPQVKQLSPVLVKQLAKTPTLDSQGRAGVMRLRSIATAQDLARVEDNYRKMRAEAEKDDLNPELYLLSGLFEMREMGRIEQVLGDLQRERPKDPQAGMVVSLYRRALRDAARSSGNP